MPKRKLNRKKEFLQVTIDQEDKAAFDAWCEANAITMSEVVRHAIAPYIAKGQKILESKS